MHSGDPDPDSSDEDHSSSVRIDSVSPIPSAVPAGALESPSHYSTPTVPVELSAVSSVLISPNRVREGVFHLDHWMRTVAPEPFDASLPPMGVESCLPLMLDGTIWYNLSLVDPGSDMSLVTIPIYPLPAGMALMPGRLPTSLHHHRFVHRPRLYLPLVTGPGRARLTLTALHWILMIILWSPQACRVAPIA